MRGVLEDVLAHAGNKPGRGVLLTLLSGSFDGEGNLLKAVECQERALAAPESSPAEVAAFVAAGFTDPGYQHLAKLYDRLGRRNDAKGVLARFEARASEYSGGLERARERQKTALQQLTLPRRPDPVEMKQIEDLLWRAGMAFNKQGSPPHDPEPEVAAALALDALDRVLRSSMWDAGFASQVLGVANNLARSNALAQSDRIYERVLPVAEKWSVDDPYPLLQVVQFRAVALESTDRAQSAIDAWRAAVISVHGKDSNAAVEVSRDQARLYERRKDWPSAIAEVQQILADQARLTGTICLEYSDVLNLAVEIYEAAARHCRSGIIKLG
jgi:tetratricopeptide (TPR) repeat protein